MSCSRRSRPRWPPQPSVEDEIPSLSRELNGLFGLGDKSDAEDVISRGTVDQYPILIPLLATCQRDFDIENGDGRMPRPSHQYKPNTGTGNKSSHFLDQKIMQNITSASSRSLTLAERLEDKIRQRRALQFRQTSELEVQEYHPVDAALPVIKPATLMDCPGEAMASPKIPMETTLPPSARDPPTGSSGISDASTLHDATPPTDINFCTASLMGSTRSSPQSLTRRIVASADRDTRELFPTFQAENGHSALISNFYLLPCPRFIPTMGHQDWYTIQGLNHLDICPSCMSQISETKFHNYFIPSFPKPANQRIRCSFSDPWTRLAWIQTIKQNHNHLGMLYQMTVLSPEVLPCPGRLPSTQYWYRIIDPETGIYLPNFDICPACIRNVRILMPQHHHTFTPDPIPKPRICDFNPESPRFVQYINLLDTPPLHPNQNQNPDLTRFLNYTRRKTTMPACPRNNPLPIHSSRWHYIRDLPELTICEDCYDDVIWPFAKTGKPLARLFFSTPRLLPFLKAKPADTRFREVSCQLYSPRMRAKVRDAVRRDDYRCLRALGLRRFRAELRFRGRMRELLDGCSWWGGLGAEWKWEWDWDWEGEVRAVEEEWRAWE